MTINLGVLKKIGIALGILLLALGVFLGVQNRERIGFLLAGKSEENGPDLSTPEGAAVLGMQAYYWRDYLDDTPEEWAARVCAVSTDIGCREAQLLALTLWDGVVLPNQVRTFAGVVSDGQARTIKDPGAQIEVWKVQVALTDPWASMDNPFPMYVMVSRINGKTRWGMEHVLTNIEVELLESEGEIDHE